MTQEKPPSRRERQMVARRALILDTAARLFAEKGFHRTTTRDIAVAADIAEGTLYNYFDNKEDLLLGIVNQLAERIRLDERLEQGLPGDLRLLFASILTIRYNMIRENGDMMQSVLSEILVNPELRERFYQDLIRPTMVVIEKHLTRLSEAGRLKGFDPALLTRFLFSISTGLYMHIVMGDPLIEQQWDALTDLIIQVVFEGLEIESAS